MNFPLVAEYNGDWVNIKLHNDGFEYAFKQGIRIRRHKGIPGLSDI